ncbi:hypothetical protein K443DRAFT_329106 [Laccaria amethystina LaAM-08-1]|jgi:hypothetical protein|uniref:Uncharacterized protein n=1 Tax=Laccaria amethystina LaAM-08-1 TaxID=1095629 RepID=A0A0C9XCJ9_9AGAR|nr:hypothetical protein K443DRAFT_329106 [Laccaria amethystina LaAM-08-1]
MNHSDTVQERFQSAMTNNCQVFLHLTIVTIDIAVDTRRPRARSNHEYLTDRKVSLPVYDGTRSRRLCNRWGRSCEVNPLQGRMGDCSICVALDFVSEDIANAQGCRESRSLRKPSPSPVQKLFGVNSQAQCGRHWPWIKRLWNNENK